jgi:hypothetical protein
MKIKNLTVLAGSKLLDPALRPRAIRRSLAALLCRGNIVGHSHSTAARCQLFKRAVGCCCRHAPSGRHELKTAGAKLLSWLALSNPTACTDWLLNCASPHAPLSHHALPATKAATGPSRTAGKAAPDAEPALLTLSTCMLPLSLPTCITVNMNESPPTYAGGGPACCSPPSSSV